MQRHEGQRCKRNLPQDVDVVGQIWNEAVIGDEGKPDVEDQLGDDVRSEEHTSELQSH